MAIFLCVCGGVWANERTLVPLEVELLRTYNSDPDGVIAKSYSFKTSELPHPGYINFRLIAANGYTHEEMLRADEEAVLRDPKTNQIYDLILGVYGFGEPLIVSARPCEKSGKLLKDSKEAYKIFFHNPLVATDAFGHRIEVQAIQGDGKFFRILVTGFEPDEELTFVSESCSEIFKKTFKITDGEATIEYAPAVIGMKEGPFRVTFFNERSPPLSIQHYWGKIAFTTPKNYQNLKKKFPTFNFEKLPEA